MRPTSIYIFRQSENAKSAYILENQIGNPIENFPSVYVQGKNSGKKYIIYDNHLQPYRKGQRNFAKNLFFHKVIDGKKEKVNLTGFNTSIEFPCKAYGDCKNPKGLNLNDAVLIELSPDDKIITLYFFTGQGDNAQLLWERWTAGKLCLVAETISIAEKDSPPSK